MNRPIIALDFPNKEEVVDFLNLYGDKKLFLKVGMELYYREGSPFVRWLRSQGHDIFLDLKLHDIPNTVYSAMKQIAQLDVAITNVHAAGGKDMMLAALKGLEEGSQGSSRPELLAVTQLTSTSDEQMKQEQNIQTSLLESVIHYAKLAEIAGCDGVVCSALEVSDIKKQTTNSFKCLTPGIRLSTDVTGDQKRVVTPKKASEIGSDYIVVGRPITQSPDPVAAYEKFVKEWSINE